MFFFASYGACEDELVGSYTSNYLPRRKRLGNYQYLSPVVLLTAVAEMFGVAKLYFIPSDPKLIRKFSHSCRIRMSLHPFHPLLPTVLSDPDHTKGFKASCHSCHPHCHAPFTPTQQFPTQSELTDTISRRSAPKPTFE